MGTHFRTPFVAVLSVCLVLAILTPPALAQNPGAAARLAQLREKAWSAGQVQAIVHFAVPDIQTLTAESARFGIADASASIAGARTLADTALAKAIEYQSYKLLTELQGTGYEVINRFDFLPFIVLRLSPQALAVLENCAEVKGIEEDVPWKLIEPVDGPGRETGEAESEGDTPLEPMLADSTKIIGADDVWSMGYTGSGWYVAVLDTGIRRTHQFFTGKTIIEACRAKGRDGKTSGGGDCPNGTWTQNGTGSAAHHPNTYWAYDHGTHVAGIATGKYGSLAGVAKDANIIAVQVFSKFSAADCGGQPCLSAWGSDIVAGMDYIYSLRGTYNIASVNLSLGGGRYYAACDTGYGAVYKASVDLLRSAGIATAIATGNSYWCGSISSPACISTAVAVGSTTKSDARSDFSNFHASMQKLFAPGSSIRSSTGDSDSSYAYWDGTSMATPHVAGAWALFKQAFPGAGVTDILNALRAYGTAIAACGTTGNPRIQLESAMTYLLSLPIYDLTTAVSPAGAGAVSPAGTTSYFSGATVSVRAAANKGYVFTGWTGALTGTANPANVTMDADKNMTANFVAGNILNAPVLLEPADGASGLGTSVTLKWEDTNSSPQETKYRIRIKREGRGYTYKIVTANTVSYLKTGLLKGKKYYWSVQAKGKGTTTKSSAFPADRSFTTAE